MPSDESVWFYVKHDDGDVQRLSLEQLDAAFQAGFIDAETLVLASDQTQWCKLGLLAGIDEAPAAAPPPQVRAQTAPAMSAAPTRARAAQPVQPPAPYSPPPLPSHRPVSVDLGVLNDAAQSQGLAADPFRPKGGKKGWAIAFLGLAAAAGIGTVVVRQPSWAAGPLSRLGIAAKAPAEPAVAWNAPAPEPAVAAQPPATTALAAPQPSPTPPSQPEATVSGMAPGLTMAGSDSHPAGDTDAKLPSKSDKGSRGPKSKPHRSRSAAPRATGHAPRKGAGPFTTSGNKFDPLNSTIQ